MIARIWRGTAALDRPEAYPEHFRRSVLPGLQQIEGFVGAVLMKRTRPAEIEFVVTTTWSSLAAIRNFAGADYTQAVVEPGAVAALLDYDRTVQHFEVVSTAADR